MVESLLVTTPSRTEPQPPIGMIDSLGTGFTTVIAHLGLILIPILLDVFLWVGPQISFYPLVERFAIMSAALPQQPAGAEAQNQLMVGLFSNLGEHINVFSMFSTTPIGVPSLMVERLLDTFSQSNPSLIFANSEWRVFSRASEGQVVPVDWQAFTVISSLIFLLFNLAAFALPGFDASQLTQVVAQGGPSTLSLTNELQLVLLVIALPLAGLLLTAIYYSLIGSVLREPKATLRDLARRSTINWAKLTAFNLLFRFLALCIGLPFILVLALLQLLSAELSGLLASLGLTAGLWLMVYISFTTQAIVLQDRGVFAALWDSVRLVHGSLLSVIGLGVLTFVLNWGMNYLFSLPDSNSWLTALGIVGHAFVSTSLVAATFVFYKDRYRWWAEVNVWVKTQKKPTVR